MLKPVRVEAGLGNSPLTYANNDPEAANFMIKYGLHFNATILAKTTDYTLIILPEDYVPNQKP